MPLRPACTAAVLVLVLGCSAAASAQTVIKPPKNKFTPEQDVQLGREAADEVRKTYPVIADERLSRYLGTIGDRLVAAAPPAFRQPVFQYSFTPVNLKDINAFALPGGPMFVNRGMIEAAADEAEVAGVMAHELAHVLLRHGTANMTKAQNPWLQLGQIAGVVGGAVVGGDAGAAIIEGSQLGFGSILLKFSREFEKQADLLGVQIMARAGYDPRALGRMFEAIAKAEAQRGGGGPQWLSSHPNPGNRTQYINQEATQLTVAAPADTSGFAGAKALVAALPPPKSDGERGRPAAADEASVGTPGRPVPPPSAQFRTITGGNVFRASVPANWTELPSSNAVKAVPQNGYGTLNGETVFSHGVEFGVAKASSRDLIRATNAWLQEIAKGNPNLRLAGTQETMRAWQRTVVSTPLVNPSPLGGRERITVYTAFLADGTTLFYYLAIAPDGEADAYRDVFRRIGESIQFADGR